MTRIFPAVATALALIAGPALAEEHVVKMLNKGSEGERMVFEPAVVMAEPGDTVRFVPEDRGHNAQSEVVPGDADDFRGKINEEVTYEVTAEGVHFVKCTPHYPLGMIALIVSGGDFSNLEEVKAVRMPGKADDRFAEYLEQAQSMAGES
jgi:pseudoazurin